jgi:aspartokinase-like uncharacterized kinase
MSSANRARRLHVLLHAGDSTSPPLTVYKIGGSLFDLPELPDVLRVVLAQRPQNAAVLIAGGGPVGDVIREWDRVHRLGDDAAHELALEGMDLTASFLARFFPEARLIRSEQQLRMAVADRVLTILCAGCFIKAAEAQGHPPLEHSWRVTSDSIAAWTAEVVAAAELVLIKSVPVPCGLSLAEATAAGLVDKQFPVVAARLPLIGWVNARAGESEIEVWHRHDQNFAANERQ